MSAGDGKRIAAKPDVNYATHLRFEARRLVMRLRDGRELAVPLEHFPSLLYATPEQRSDWELLGGGRGIHWPDLDLDLSVNGLLQGFPERIPRPPSIKRPKLAASSVGMELRRRKRRAG